MRQLYRKEISTYLDSLIAYVVILVFLTTVGLLIWVFPDTSVLRYGFADLYTLFSVTPYVFMFLIPAITMRSIAEEAKSGTLELLFTQPLSDFDIVLGKFLAAWTIAIFAIAPTIIYYFSVYLLGSPVGNLDSAGIAGSYIGLVMLAGLFTSVGVMTSSLTKNQVIAFVLAVFGCFLLFSGFDSLASTEWLKDHSTTIRQFGVLHHYNALSKGLVDSRNLIYFLSGVSIMLMLTKLNLSSRKW